MGLDHPHCADGMMNNATVDTKEWFFFGLAVFYWLLGMTCTQLVQMRMVATIAETENEYKALLFVLVHSDNS